MVTEAAPYGDSAVKLVTGYLEPYRVQVAEIVDPAGYDQRREIGRRGRHIARALPKRREIAWYQLQHPTPLIGPEPIFVTGSRDDSCQNFGPVPVE